MRIVEFTAYIVTLRLRKPFHHASYSRNTSENVFVQCRLADGTQGWGEGVPRPYVTAESPEGVLTQLAATDLAGQFDRDCHTWDDVIALCCHYEPAVLEADPRGCRTNSHRCAVELSILDAYGRIFGEPVSAVTSIFEAGRSVAHPSESVQYSGVVSVSNRATEITSALKTRLYGFRHCKVKVGVSRGNDRARMRRVRRWLGTGRDIRVDVNGAWHPTQVIDEVAPLLQYGISCVEQPVAHEHVAALKEIRQRLQVPVMLDESLTSVTDAESAIRDETCDLFNIRLSKCGGFLNSLRLAALARSAGLGYQLGCHPGESGILSAAGRHFATSVQGIRYAEGSYDRHVLEELLTNEDITFGYGGRAPALRGPGLGVTVNRAALDRSTLRRQQFSLR
ncbi:MAG: enolase C-terminal domain-like protein [Pirellulaceae bacterium]